MHIDALFSQFQTGRFPANFRELEARVWKHKQAPDFGAEGRSLTVANYYYIYYPVDASTCTGGGRSESGNLKQPLPTPG